MRKLLSSWAFTFLLPVCALLAYAFPCGADMTVPGGLMAMNSPSEADDEGFPDDFEDAFEEEADEKEIAVSDPLEPYNRAVFWFNDKFYFYLLKPVARGYRAVVPEPARVSVANFFRNLLTPARLVNCVLQGKVDDAGNELGRFMINTTIGIGGLFDPAKEMTSIGAVDEDLGQTLGLYGIGSGPYIVWPFLGPSNLRDTLGLVGDYFLDPRIYLVPDEERYFFNPYYVGVRTFETVNETALDKDTYESIKRQALDPYGFVKNGYAQRRIGKIAK